MQFGASFGIFGCVGSDVTRRTVQQLRDARWRIEQRQTVEQERQRVEDRIREDLRDQRSITIRHRAGGPPGGRERRRGRTDDELRHDIDKLREQWERERRKPRQAKTRKRKNGNGGAS